MSFGTEVDAIAYKAMAEQCARARVEVDSLRAQLNEAQRKIHALESAHLAANPWPVRWRFDHGISREAFQNMDTGSLGHFYASHAVLDEEMAIRFSAHDHAIDAMRHHLWSKIQTMIRHGVHRDERARCTVYTGEVIIGALDPKNPNLAQPAAPRTTK